MEGKIRDATAQDGPAIQVIYAPFVTDTVASFEYIAPSVSEMVSRITATLITHPFLVYEDKHGRVIGYAYGSRHKSRAGYQWIAESSIYLAPEARGSGIGTALYTKLFQILAQLGFYKIIAGIAGSNPVSDTFHRKFGFVPVATWPQLGYKCDTWVDVVWYSKELRSTFTSPNPPKPPILYAEWRKSQQQDLK